MNQETILTEEQQKELYMKLTKNELCDMLIECNKRFCYALVPQIENETTNNSKQMAYDTLLGTVYLLWSGERTGTTEPDRLEGVFTSIDEMNKYLDDKYYKFPIDTSGLKFTKDVRRHSQEGKFGDDQYVYYEETTLNCA